MSFEYLNPLVRRGAMFTASNSQQTKTSGVLMMGWKPEDDTYAGSGETEAVLERKRVKVGDDDLLKLPSGTGTAANKDAQSAAELTVFSKPFQTLNKRDFRILREANGIRISYPFQNSFEFRVIRDWNESGLLEPVRVNLARNMPKLRQPTPVQMQVIPVALKFKDIICTAPTGSGKTLAFLLPLINFLYFMPRIKPDKAHLGPYAIVILPTRELVLQCAEVFNQAAAGLNLNSKTILGGRDKLDNLFDPAEVVFATVGRYSDLLDLKEASLSQCYYVVVDEADFMIGNNLAEPLDFILKFVADLNNKSADPVEAFKEEEAMENFNGLVRVTQLFSATMPAHLKTLTDKYLRSPVSIQIEANQEQLEKKQHFFEYLGDGKEGLFGQKLGLLKVWLRRLEYKVIVFFNSKNDIDQVYAKLKGNRANIGCYHSGFDQSERERIISKFRSGEFEVLLSTDLGGRGLDIENIRSVVNFDSPKDFEQYVHRTGRTARAGKSGVCLSFFSKQDAGLFEDVANVLVAGKQKIPDFLMSYVDKRQKSQNNTIFAE